MHGQRPLAGGDPQRTASTRGWATALPKRPTTTTSAGGKPHSYYVTTSSVVDDLSEFSGADQSSHSRSPTSCAATPATPASTSRSAGSSPNWPASKRPCSSTPQPAAGPKPDGCSPTRPPPNSASTTCSTSTATHPPLRSYSRQHPKPHLTCKDAAPATPIQETQARPNGAARRGAMIRCARRFGWSAPRG